MEEETNLERSSVKMMIVLRKDLNMRKGKMVAQGAHAATQFLLQEIGRYRPDGTFGVFHFDPPELTDDQLKWLNEGTTKICAGVDSEQELLDIFEKAKAVGLTVHLIDDYGLTEFKGVYTKTCLAIGPNKADEIDKITGNLKLI